MFATHRDWFMRQIQAVGEIIARLIFGRAEIAYEIQDEANYTQADMLHLHLLALLRENRINEAEEYIFERLDPTDNRYLMLALDFYQRVNMLSDDELEQANFSREEIESGMNEIITMFGVKI